MKNLVEGAKQIVCIAPKGRGKVLVEALSTEFGIYNSNYSHARGVGRSADVQDRGLGEVQEKDVFTVTVEQAQADEVFEFLYEKAEIDELQTGLIYMQAAPQTTLMHVPDFSQDD